MQLFTGVKPDNKNWHNYIRTKNPHNPNSDAGLVWAQLMLYLGSEVFNKEKIKALEARYSELTGQTFKV